MKNCPYAQQARICWNFDNPLEGIVGERNTPSHVGRVNFSRVEDVGQSLAPGKTGGILGEGGRRSGLFNFAKGVQVMGDASPGRDRPTSGPA